jgi:transcriptional regulator with XRE-family HTH domain
MGKETEAGRRIRALRGHLTQAEFAKCFGVTQSMISAWEAGRDVPSAEIWIKLGELSGYPDCYWFWQQAGLDQQKLLAATEQMLRDQIRDADSPLLEGQIVLVPRVHKTPQGLEPAGLPLAMPVEAIPNPLSTYCFQLDEVEAVGDTAGADGGSLSPFLGELILLEELPYEGIARPPFLGAGLYIGMLLGPIEFEGPEGISYGVTFLPSERLKARSYLRVEECAGVWVGKSDLPAIKRPTKEEERRNSDQYFSRLSAKFPRQEGESDKDWFERLLLSEPMPKIDSEEFQRVVEQVESTLAERAREGLRLFPHCKIIGRVLLHFPLSVKTEGAK